MSITVIYIIVRQLSKRIKINVSFWKGYGVTGSNLKTIRQLDAAKSSVKIKKGSSKFAQPSKVPILLDIPTGIQVTPGKNDYTMLD